MNSAYMNKLLLIDLDTKTSEIISLSEELKEYWIGGKGFGAKLLFDLLPERCDPLGKDNLLMFMTGPLTGTMAPAMRGCIVTKSPLTNAFLDSYFGGRFAPEIKYAGYDGIIIKGKADKPVYISIHDKKIEIRDAEGIWGLDTLQANQAVKDQLKDESFKVVTIGQAGEHLIPFSLICCEYNRQAGRGGAGAVMGSKNLKAIAVRGTNLVKVNDGKRFKAACKTALNDLDKSEDINALKQAGTASAVEFANEAGLFPHRNYSGGTFDKAPQLAEKGQAKHLWLGSSACMGCPIRCSKMGAVRTGRYKGIVTDMVEYESAGLMGANLDIADIRAVAHLVKLCDRFGMDSMSTGSVIGFAMEAAEKGLIDSPDEVEIKFASAEAADYLIRAIAEKRGRLGKLLAQGVKKAAQEMGSTAESFAVHVKGMEAPAWGPRGASGMGLAIMTADRGACHQRAFPIANEIGGEEWQGKTFTPCEIEGKADLVFALQNYAAGTDTLVKCDFGSFGIQPSTYSEMLCAATGKDFKENIFDIVGERIWNLTRLFNLREGMDVSDEKLPPRFVNEPLPDGPHKGERISEQDMAYMKEDYYRARGWDKNGTPANETLKRLGIKGLLNE
ncbi:MAG: aldehyde ferredoxin oxidoreductase family protein [Thermodesulfobacteriota bacterium]|nr:aldehyde ferredoxin oxidoreductase family protein [Thermodesulfobacteriota bacterium]